MDYPIIRVIDGGGIPGRAPALPIDVHVVIGLCSAPGDQFKYLVEIPIYTPIQQTIYSVLTTFCLNVRPAAQGSLVNRITTTVINLALLLLLGTGAQAATFTVTKTADTNDGNCDADCSLREAVSAANCDGAPSTINFAVSLAHQTVLVGCISR